MDRLPSGTKIMAKWSDLGSPLTPGIYDMPQFGGKVEITAVTLQDAATLGGNPDLRLENWARITDSRNYWTVRSFTRPETV